MILNLQNYQTDEILIVMHTKCSKRNWKTWRVYLGFGTKTHWTSFRLCQLVDEEPATVSNLDSLRKLTTIRFIFPVEADRAINNPVSHFGVGGWQPAGDCSSTSPARNTFGSHPISGGRKKPVPSRCKLLITQCGRACHDGGSSIICVQCRIDFALLFWTRKTELLDC